jgi:drug/metabolite transporter (DMT)-like permease
MYTDDLRRASLLMLASSALFAGMGALIKVASATLSNEMVVFFRSAIGLAALLPWLAHQGLGRLATTRLGGHAIRSLVGLAAMYCYFYAIGQMHLGEATLFNYASPLFIPLVALVWLRERIPARLWISIGLGFLGLVLILKPGAGVFRPVSFVGLAAGVLTAIAMTSIRHLTRTEPATRVVFYFSLVSTVVSVVPLFWFWHTPSGSLWLVLIAIGVLATGAQLLMTRAYAHAAAAQVGPFTYATVVFATLAGWALWGERPDALSMIGMVLVAIAGMRIIRGTDVAVAPAGEMLGKK